MRDKVTLDNISKLHPKLRDEALKIYEEICAALTGKAICRFIYTLRTFAEQDALYAQGRTKLFDSKGNRLGIVTKSKGGQSYHCYGIAIDIVLVVDTNGDGNPDTAKWDMVTDFDKDGLSDWMEVVDIFKKYKWEWGGDWIFKDPPHFQKTFGYKWKDLLAMYKSGNVDSQNYVKI